MPSHETRCNEVAPSSGRIASLVPSSPQTYPIETSPQTLSPDKIFRGAVIQPEQLATPPAGGRPSPAPWRSDRAAYIDVKGPSKMVSFWPQLFFHVATIQQGYLPPMVAATAPPMSFHTVLLHELAIRCESSRLPEPSETFPC